jgi:hypothetical protein
MTYSVWEDHVVPDLCEQFNAVRAAKKMPDQWALLVLDGFGAHSYSIKALKMLKENKIIVIRLPSHTSSALQPLDVAVFRSVKSNNAELMKAFIMHKCHTQRKTASLTKFEMAKIFHLSWKKVRFYDQ